MARNIPRYTAEQVVDRLAGRRVRIYYNLNNKCWSVKDMKMNRVVCHADELFLDFPLPVVSEAGRQRVIREKRKWVHAYIEGTVSPVPREGTWKGISYNPYKASYFYFGSTGGEFKFARAAAFRSTRRVEVAA